MGGLPLHPLVVHAAVVLLPLSSLALILLIFVRKWRPHYAWLAVAGVVAGTLATIAGAITGNVFAESVGRPGVHATLGAVLMWASIVFSISAVLWWFLQYRTRNQETEPRLVSTVGIVTAVLAVATLIFTVLVGHSGAEAAWGGRIADVGQSSQPSPSVAADQDEARAAQSAEDSGSSDAAAGDSSVADEGSVATEGVFTAAEVAEHNDSASCWASVDGTVYDLTEWISQHPGGSARIERICGTDATATFAAQHSSSQEAQQELQSLKIGELG